MPRGGRQGGGRMAQRMARMMAARRMRRRRRRRILLIGGMVALGYAGYKMSQKNVERVEEHTGKDADELTDEQLEQAMEQLGIEPETMTDEKNGHKRRRPMPSLTILKSSSVWLI
ncbi:MAG: hypothetical protein ACERKR_08710 [Deltaproteobacteria bacterium]